MPPKYFKTARDFERWLAVNHGKASSLLVGIYKVGSDKASITYPDALDAALAYGWIDGVRKSLDADAYTIRFTPRKKGSYWSTVNTKRAQELIKSRRMKPAGLAAFKRRDEEKTRRYSYERENATLDAAAPFFFRHSERLRFFLRYRQHETLTNEDKQLLRRVLTLATPMRERQLRRIREVRR